MCHISVYIYVNIVNNFYLVNKKNMIHVMCSSLLVLGG